MTNIPFPNPHDAEALNSYLDALAAGKQATPNGDVQQAAAAMHALANQSLAIVPDSRFESQPRGNQMQTAAYSPPISNRTRTSQSRDAKERRRQSWLSMGLVAALLLSIISYAWWNGAGGPDEHNNIAWAPGTAEAMEGEPSPWTAPISFKECPEDAERNAYDPNNPGGTLYTQEDYDSVSLQRSYDIVGSPDPDDAENVVQRLREAYGCIASGKTTLKVTARFEYENRTTAGRASAATQSDERAAASDSVSAWLENELGLTPMEMYVAQNPDDLDLDGTEALITLGLYNPDHAVLFADGRIGVIPSVVSYAGFPAEVNEDTVAGFPPTMSIFVLQNGEWMLDETLPVCIGDCSAPAASPVSGGDLPGTILVATPE